MGVGSDVSQGLRATAVPRCRVRLCSEPGRLGLGSMKTLEFFFDVSSPWTYLAFTRIHGVLERTKARIVWKPILVGGVFNAVNQDVYERRANPDPRKASYSGQDFQ